MTNSNQTISRKVPDSQTLQEDPGYRKILELDFSEMIPFVFSNIRKPGLASLFYIVFNMASLLFMVIYALWSIKSGHITFWRALAQCIAGIASGSILVILPHEILHGVAYRLLGARKIRFGMDLKQFIFYVTADRFPISGMELVFLALTPFFLINLVVISGTALWAEQLILFSSSFLISHNIMCIGDFALINYTFSQKSKIYTFDDTSLKRSYFYKRENKKL